MERVKKGERYWYINDVLLILECIETDSPIDKARFEAGNYFHSSHKLSDMSFKLEKVLKGADVIRMPTEEEMKYLYPPQITNDEDVEFHEGMRVGISNTIDVFKDKIIK